MLCVLLMSDSLIPSFSPFHFVILFTMGALTKSQRGAPAVSLGMRDTLVSVLGGKRRAEEEERRRDRLKCDQGQRRGTMVMMVKERE